MEIRELFTDCMNGEQRIFYINLVKFRGLLKCLAILTDNKKLGKVSKIEIL